MRHEERPPFDEDLYAVYEETGDRLAFEAVYFKRREFLAVFGLVNVIKQQPEDIHKLEQIIRDICSEPTWALPAHVDRKEAGWENTVDLFAAETAQALAEITDILKNHLSPEVRELVRIQVEKRVLKPFYQAPIPYRNWEAGHNNWCAVCAGCIGMTSICLYKEKPRQLEQYLNRILSSLTHYIDGFPEDGTCMEGLSYFTYGMSYYAAFAEMYNSYTNGALDLLDSKKCRNIALFQQKCYFTSRRNVCFSDSGSREPYRIGLTSYLACRCPGVQIPDIALAAGLHTDSCYRWSILYRDLIWPSRYLPENAVQNKESGAIGIQYTLPNAQWSICRSKNDIGFAAKGGHNDEYHNHNDVGSFHYAVGIDVLLADLGAGEYTKDYFSDKRYDILCNRSLSHNVPLINGTEQASGNQAAGDRFYTDGKGTVYVSFAGAYETEGILKLERKMYFDLDNGGLTVTDQFICTEGIRSITENLVTQYKPVIKGNRVMINGAEESCFISIESVEAVRCEKKVFYNHKGIPEDVYLLQWDIKPCIPNTLAQFQVIPNTGKV